MKAVVASLAAAALAAPSPISRPVYSGPPPARYMPLETVQVVLYVSVENMPKVCPTKDRNVTVYGCVRYSKEGKVTFLLNPCYWAGEEFYATIACHEKAHITGWPGNHPL